MAKAKIFNKQAIQKCRKALSDQVVLTPTDATQSQSKAEDVIFDTESGEHYRIKQSTFDLKYKLQKPEDIERFDAG